MPVQDAVHDDEIRVWHIRDKTRSESHPVFADHVLTTHSLQGSVTHQKCHTGCLSDIHWSRYSQCFGGSSLDPTVPTSIPTTRRLWQKTTCTPSSVSEASPSKVSVPPSRKTCKSTGHTFRSYWHMVTTFCTVISRTISSAQQQRFLEHGPAFGWVTADTWRLIQHATVILGQGQDSDKIHESQEQLPHSEFQVWR
jgi:hypothetical protein